jgi:hypothetical protein
MRKIIFCITMFGNMAIADIEISVKNPISVERQSETISLQWKDINFSLEPNDISVFSGQSPLLTQSIDLNGDGKADELLFQDSFKANEIKNYAIRLGRVYLKRNDMIKTFARYVPERADDFAWENDKIAFRMYGPALEKSTERSGVDCWLKRVPESIIDKWYGQMKEKIYHKDWGEGYDPYHVGSGLGCGGTGIWENGNIVNSNVYNSWKVIANGPIRTIFELSYDKSWQTSGKNIKEIKRVTIDLGQRFCRFDTIYSGPQVNEIKELAIGVTTHDGKAAAYIDSNPKMVLCSENIDGDYLGTAAFTVNNVVKSMEVKSKDGIYATIIVQPKDFKITHYAGYGWQRAGEITSLEQWKDYTLNCIKCINNPLEIEIKGAKK